MARLCEAEFVRIADTMYLRKLKFSVCLYGFKSFLRPWRVPRWDRVWVSLWDKPSPDRVKVLLVRREVCSEQVDIRRGRLFFGRHETDPLLSRVIGIAASSRVVWMQVEYEP